MTDHQHPRRRAFALTAVTLLLLIPLIVAQGCSSPSEKCPSEILAQFEREYPQAEIVTCTRIAGPTYGRPDGTRQNIQFNFGYRNPGDEKTRTQVWMYESKNGGPPERKSKGSIYTLGG